MRTRFLADGFALLSSLLDLILGSQARGDGYDTDPFLPIMSRPSLLSLSESRRVSLIDIHDTMAYHVWYARKIRVTYLEVRRGHAPGLWVVGEVIG